jgi:hypothetical protein
MPPQHLHDATPDTVRRGGCSGKPHPKPPRNPAEKGQVLRKKHRAQGDEQEALKEGECEAGDPEDQQNGSKCDTQIT